MTLPLTGKQRRFLRALAHPLKPVVQTGHAGLTPQVLSAIDIALETHELIKVKIGSEAEVSPGDLSSQVESGTASTVAQIIGRVLVVYRPRKKEPRIVLPAPTDPPDEEE